MSLLMNGRTPMLQQALPLHPGGLWTHVENTPFSLHSQLFFLSFSKDVLPRSPEAFCCGTSFQGEGEPMLGLDMFRRLGASILYLAKFHPTGRNQSLSPG